MSRHHAVLAQQADIGQVIGAIEDAFDQVEQTMLFVYSFSEETAGARSHIWRRQGGASVLVRLVEDHVMPANYVIAEAVDDSDLRTVWEALAPRLATVDLDDLQSPAVAEMERDPRALERLALGAGEIADARTVEIVRSGLFSANENVRASAAMAAGITQWPEFVGVLKAVLESESDPLVRRTMEGALAACQRPGDGEGQGL